MKEHSYSPEDLETWTRSQDPEAWSQEALGERPVSDKKLRRAAKDAKSMIQRGSLPAGTESADAGTLTEPSTEADTGN